MSKIVIDGNIGAGKSTQLTLLEKANLKVQKEPIEQWPLELFYSDPERWGLLFQLVILKTLPQLPGFCIYERCPLSSLKVFWELMKKNPWEDITYRKYYEDYGWSPDVYIYIRTPPDVCLERIKSRTQEGDTSVTLDYLRVLDQKYMQMYNDMTCEKYIIDGTESQEIMHEKILTIVNGVQMEKL